MIRFEFAPFDLGSSVRSAHLRGRIERVAKDLGWSEARTLLDQEVTGVVLPMTVGIWEKDGVTIYVPESGFAVARYRYEVSGETAEERVVDALFTRREFQQSLGDEHSADPALSTVEDFAQHARAELQRRGNTERRIIPKSHLHAYSLSVVWAEQDIEDRLLGCLLNPKQIGLAVSGSESSSIQQALHTLQSLQPSQDSRVALDIGESKVWSSWSSVVVSDPSGTSGIDLVSLCEFRLQSTWFGAHSVTLASHESRSIRNRAARLNAMQIHAADLRRVHALMDQRLGPNAPSAPTKVLKALTETSDIKREVEHAVTAINVAVAEAQFDLERSQSGSRRLVAVFTLIFASAGLAQVLLPLPITGEVIQENTVVFSVWAAVTTLGAVMVAASNR